MNLSIGIVGLPNVGKSTLFNALLKRQVAEVSNYPFCTIEPHVGVVEVPDERLTVLSKIINVPRIVPAVVKFVDIAGLVKGAAEGQGLGNKFLSHIRELSVICQVVRDFRDDNVMHVSGEVNPKADIEIINSELVLADLETVSKTKFGKSAFFEGKAKIQNEEDKHLISAVNKLLPALKEGKLAKEVDLTPEEHDLAKNLHLLTLKPMIYVINVDEKSLKNLSTLLETNPFPDFGQGNNPTLAICAKIEAELADLSPEDQKEYLKQLGLEKSGLERLIQLAYKTLNLISFFTTTGNKEVRAWTIEQGTKAPQAAGVIHTDFEKGFIKAEVARYDDFVQHGGWQGVRQKGLARFEGKDYVIQEGEVVEFKVNA